MGIFIENENNQHRSTIRFTGSRWSRRCDPRDLAVEKTRRIADFLHGTYSELIGTGEDEKYVVEHIEDYRRFELENHERFMQALGSIPDKIELDEIEHPPTKLGSPEAYLEIRGYTTIQKLSIACYDPDVRSEGIRSFRLDLETPGPSYIDERQYHFDWKWIREEISRMKNTSILRGGLYLYLSYSYPEPGKNPEFLEIVDNVKRICREAEECHEAEKGWEAFCESWRSFV